MKINILKQGFIKGICLIMVFWLGVFAPFSTTYALSKEELDKFSQSDILFYDPSANESGCYNGNLSGDTIMAKVTNYLKGNNPTHFVLSNEGIAGILASFQGESGFNPFRFQSDRLRGPAYGIAQFDPMSQILGPLKSDPRTSNYYNEYFDLKYTYYNTETGLPKEYVPMEVVDAWLTVQLDYFFGPSSEFENTKVRTYRNIDGKGRPSTMGLDYIDGNMTAHEAMDAAKTAEDAARIFVWIMERPANKEDAANRRSEYAKKWLEYVESYTSGSSDEFSSSSSDGSNVTIIGDSITVGSEGKIKELLPDADIHAQVSKQFYRGNADNPGGVEILKDLADNGKLRDILVFALGTNSSGVTESQVKEVIKLAGNTRKVIFVTNYTTTNDYIGNNNNFIKAKNENENMVYIADWKSAIESQTDKYLSSDGIHPNVEGQELFASIINNVVNDVANAVTSCIQGSVDGGLSEGQSQKLAEYYNSSEVNISEYFTSSGKRNCVAFSAFFVQRFTSIGKVSRRWGNGKDVAHNLAVKYNLPTGSEPRPFAVFSVTQGISMCGEHKCGHTGIVVAVDGDSVTTVEASFPSRTFAGYLGKVVHRNKSYFYNTQYGDSFTYLDGILSQPDLAEIVGN